MMHISFYIETITEFRIYETNLFLSPSGVRVLIHKNFRTIFIYSSKDEILNGKLYPSAWELRLVRVEVSAISVLAVLDKIIVTIGLLNFDHVISFRVQTIEHLSSSHDSPVHRIFSKIRNFCIPKI